jgi:hypothetical protein
MQKKYVMYKKLPFRFVVLAGVFFLLGYRSNGQEEIDFSRYHTYAEVQEALESLNRLHPENTALHALATSPGGQDVVILEIGKNRKERPAVFVAANWEGITPLSTEGALYLAQMFLNLENDASIKWYILPVPNPDASEVFFSSMVYQKATNDRKNDKDVDGLVDEDGPEDLNGDGYITQMRVKDPEGAFKISPEDSRIMVRADTKKGERGEYKVYPEGIDNDGDGSYNEDGPGGVNPGINFPHLFDHKNKDAGLYAGYTPETYAVMKFIYEHPEIAMVFTLGTSDFCIAPPQGGREGGANMKSLKIPRRYATMLGADPDKTYSMEEVIELVKPMVPEGVEVTPSMIASFMGLGAAVNPQEDDLKFYTKLSEDYKAYLKEKNFNTERLEPEKDKNGSFELWAYYHLGLPSFSMNLFTVPEAKEEKTDDKALSLEEVEKMEAEDFVALGEEKIDAFLKAHHAPDRFSAKGIIEMMNSGRVTPKQMAGMMKNMPAPTEEGKLSTKDKSLLAYIDKDLDGKGFASWESYDHPTLGEVEIGGYLPYVDNTPPAERMDTLCSVQLPWLLKLTEKLPDLHFLEEKVTPLGGGIYKLEIYVENRGYFPYPISMGQRNSQPAPVIISLEENDLDFLDGLKRTPLGNIGGNQVKKLTWIVKTEKPQTITARIESKNAGSDSQQIRIGGSL